jgi:hypothetical protein
MFASWIRIFSKRTLPASGIDEAQKGWGQKIVASARFPGVGDRILLPAEMILEMTGPLLVT